MNEFFMKDTHERLLVALTGVVVAVLFLLFFGLVKINHNPGHKIYDAYCLGVELRVVNDGLVYYTYPELERIYLNKNCVLVDTGMDWEGELP